MIAGFGGVGAPRRLASGHWVSAVSWPTNVDDPDDAVRRIVEANQGGAEFEAKFQASVDLFDAEGRFLYSLMSGSGRNPEVGTILFVGPDDRVYTRSSDPFPQIRRYRVEIREFA